MKDKVEEGFLKKIDYIKKIKENTQDVEKNLDILQEKLGEILSIQESLFKYVELTLKFKCNVDQNGKFTKLKNQIFSIIKEIWILSQESQLKLQDIKERTDKSLSLIKSFYDKTTKDKLTWLWNDEFINNLIQLLWEDRTDFFLVYFDLNNVKEVNDKFWHLAGDMLIKEFANKLVLLFGEEKNFVGRIHWDEFNVVSLESKENLDTKLKRLDSWMENLKFTIKDEKWKEHKISVSVACGYASNKEVSNITDLIRLADKRMYTDKFKKKQGKIS